MKCEEDINTVEKFQKKTFSTIAFVLIALVMGLRKASVGCDLVKYQYRYFNAESLLTELSSEKGFSYFNYIFSSLGVTWQTYLMIVTVLTLSVLIYFFYRYSPNVMWSIFIYVTIGTFTMCMSGIRQSLAVSIVLIALILLLNKKMVLPILLILLASTFHTSAVAALILIPIVRIRLSRKSTGILIAISSGSLFYRKYLNRIITLLSPEKYSGVSLDSGYQINSLLIVIAILIPIFCLIFMVDVDEDGKYNRETSTLFCMSCLNIIFTILTISNNQVGRIAYYFVNANAVLIPLALQQMEYRNKVIASICIIVPCLIYFYLGTVGGTLQIDNYLFYWQ